SEVAPPPPSPPMAAEGADGEEGRASLPSRDELTLAWGDDVLASLSPRAKSRFAAGRFVAVEGGRAVFALPNGIHRERCEEVRGDVEAALSEHFGRPVPLRLVVESGGPSAAPGAPSPQEAGLEGPEHGPGEAGPPVTSPEDRLLKAFPGAEEVS
ncbi:MAG: hypothetical protein M3N31_08920, partial [Actinomycetota bacterium]|nr:hypothetical protein [Actinomycetota bacterium]